jgi:hypothetical protein
MDSCRYCKSAISRESNVLFCPECGANLFDLEQEAKRRQKSGIKKVNIKRQIFFSMIPFMSLVAAYRVRKLRRAFIIYAIAAAISLSVIEITYLVIETRYAQLSEAVNREQSTDEDVQRSESFRLFFDDFRMTLLPLLVLISLYLIPSLVMVYFIRKWSMRWNEEIALLQHLH